MITEILNQIHIGNNLDLFPKLEDETIDLVLTSPPYDDLRKYKGYVFEFEKIAEEIERVLKPGGCLVWVVGDKTTKEGETFTSLKQALYFKQLGLWPHDTMIYAKNAIPYPDTKRYYNCFEYMFVFSKGEMKTFNPIMDRKNKNGGQKVGGTERKADGSLKVKPGIKSGLKIKEYGFRWNVWKYNVGGKHTYQDKYFNKQPAIFPYDLAKDHILSWTNEGDVVLDPMCGSGRTCKVAKDLNRNFIGFEISEDYVEIGNSQIEECVYFDNGEKVKVNDVW